MKSRLVNLVAPRSWRDVLAKSLVFLLLINGTNLLVTALIAQARPA